MKTAKNQPIPYLFDYYNVSAFYENPLSFEDNTLLRLLNAFTKALNGKDPLANPKTKQDKKEKVFKPYQFHLPRMILVVPDWDIPEVHQPLFVRVTNLSGKCIDCILNNMERSIEARKDELRRRRPGALAHNEPNIIWIKMINRSTPQRILAVRNKFNKILVDLLANRRYHYILDVNRMVDDPRNFTYDNHFNTRGQAIYWNEVDRLLERFDQHKEPLRPEKQAENLPEPEARQATFTTATTSRPTNTVQPRMMTYPKDAKFY